MVASKWWIGVSAIGSPFVYGPLLLIMLSSSHPLSMRAIIAMGLLEIVGGTIKLTYAKDRPRPMRLSNSLWNTYRSRSFPSIHSGRITAMTIILTVSYGYLLLVPLAIACIAVMYSRVALKLHDWFDVGFGASLGLIVSIGFMVF